MNGQKLVHAFKGFASTYKRFHDIIATLFDAAKSFRRRLNRRDWEFPFNEYNAPMHLAW